MTRFIDDYLLYLLAQASADTSAAFHAVLDGRSIPVSTWRILASLYPESECGITDLARDCQTKQSTMTRQVDRLLVKGLIQRDQAKTDRRRAVVRLSVKGKALAAELTEQAKVHEKSVLENCTPQEIETLKQTLKRLRGEA